MNRFQIVSAFLEWERNRTADPDAFAEFYDYETPLELAEAQADYFLEILESLNG